MTTAALILANDPGEGFAGPKYLHPVKGSAMIDVVLSDVAEWPVDETVVVLGPDAEAVLEASDLEAATVVIDPEWREGLAASLRVGIDVIERTVEADRLVISNADQPGIGADTVAALLDALGKGGAAVPKYRYRRGWPIVVAADLGDMMLRLEGSVDLHDLLESHVDDVAEVWIDSLEPTRLRSPVDLPGSRDR